MLAKSLDKEDRKMFFFQLDSLDWFSFIEQYILGTRKFVLKQDPDTIPACRNKMYVLWLADRMLKIFMIYLLYKLCREQLLRSSYHIIIGSSRHARFQACLQDAQRHSRWPQSVEGV